MDTTLNSTQPNSFSFPKNLRTPSLGGFATAAMAGLVVGGTVFAGIGYHQMTSRLAEMEDRSASLRSQLTLLSGSYLDLDRKANLSLAQAASLVRESVVMIGTTDPDSGVFSPFGTAWVADEREGTSVLATNAHVARAAAEREGRGKIVVRRAGESGTQDWNVKEFIIHEGSEEFAFIADRPMLRQGSDGPEPVQFVEIADVAIVTLEGGSWVGAPLAIADSAMLNTLQPGTEVAILGHPIENMIGPRDQQPALLGLGRLLALSDYTFRSAAPYERHLLHHDIRMSGGSSGSPLLMLDEATGNAVVIGLHSAGDMVPIPGGRVQAGGAYAQRSDLLLDLLGRDLAWSAEMIQHWWKSVAESTMSVEGRLELIRSLAKESTLDQGVDLAGLYQTQLFDQTVRIPALGGERAEETFTLKVQAGQIIAVGATADNWADMDLFIFFQGRRIAYNNRLDGIPWCVVSLPVDGEITIAVVTDKTYNRESSGVVRAWVLNSPTE